MKKLSADTNALNWFEIPVISTERAKKFYETILDIEMQTQYVGETKEEVTFFPFTPGVVRATSGIVSGILVKNDRNKPSMVWPLIYLNADPDIQTIVDRIETAGGKVLLPKTKIMAGYFSVFVDTEGNRIGLHAAS
jgi:predicted enzyme related to lactoylglutathione lyase